MILLYLLGAFNIEKDLLIEHPVKAIEGITFGSADTSLHSLDGTPNATCIPDNAGIYDICGASFVIGDSFV